MDRNKELRVIPRKNYIILGIVILVTILLLYYFYMWVDAYQETKLNRPILNRYMDVINYNELNDYLIENPNTIIYVSVLEDATIREFEKKFKVLFRTKQLNRDILYLDITEDIKNRQIKNEMNNTYASNSSKMTDIPVIMVIDNGNLRSIYSIRENDYDVDRVKNFINSIKFSEEDEING